jgi:phosphonate transport system substrate-binding protein
MKHWFTIIGLAAGLAFGGTAAAQTKELNFGFISTESSSNLKTAWQPLLDDMSKATGIKVNAFFAPDYAGVIEGMRFNKVQVAWMGKRWTAPAARCSPRSSARTAPRATTRCWWFTRTAR